MNLRAKRLEAVDRPACEEFFCGDKPFETQVARFIRELVWQGRPAGERTILAYAEETGDLFGFGSWKFTSVELPGGEVVDVIRIPYFGVDSRFKGSRAEDGTNLAGRLYSTVEADARADPAATEGMPVELYCVAGNERGLRFWQGRGFEEIGETDFGSVRYKRMLKRASGA